MAALIILGLLLALVRPMVNGVTSRWRLRAAAQQVESVVQWAQNAAAVRGEPVQVLYDVPDGSYWVRVGDETHALHRLPGEVSFASVRFGEIKVTRDVAACGAFPDGTLDSHEVILRTTDDSAVRLTFDRLTGEPSYEEGPFDELR